MTVTTSESDWRQLDRMLDALLDLAPEQRAPRLAEIGREDSALASRLQRLLDGLGRSDAIEQLAASPLCAEALSSLSGLGPGSALGSWKLLARIGHGGMAEVFEAERHVNGARQHVALKVMALGLGGSEQLRRFRQETAILARLDDPRLSRLIDAGTAPDGRPWLAMEYVDGEPIDQACDRRGVGTEERVRHLIQVALAVDHAHRQLVVHRDLKPGNILLDCDGQIRLLDFGIAKVVLPDRTETEFTATHARAYTLRYASPEQLAGAPTGVSSDVYQLGLLLHLLLTGQRPFAAAGEDPLQRLAAMRAGAPLPSSVIAADAQVTSSRSATRARIRELRGDLDSIVLHALEADPEARYPGARELADDLQRWLDRRPVLARQQSRGYRIGRYLRRHWIGAVAISVIALLLLGYAITLTWQSARLAQERNEAQQARLRAESIQHFLLEVFGSVDPQAPENHGKSIEELLVAAIERARTDFAGQPLLAAELLLSMGEVLARRSRLTDAERALREALALREGALGEDDASTLAVLPSLGDVLYQQGRLVEAHEILSRYRIGVERRFGPESDEAVQALLALGPVDSTRGEIETAEQHLRTALRIHDARHARNASTRANAETRARLVHQLAVILLRAKRYAEAETLLAAAVRAHLDLFGAIDQRSLDARKNLAFALRMLLRPAEAQREMAAVIADERLLYGGPHRQIAFSLGHLANLYSDQKDYARAEAHWREARAEAIAALGESHPWIQSAEYGIARSQLLGGQEDEGRAALQRLAALTGREDDVARNAAAMLDKYPPSTAASR